MAEKSIRHLMFTRRSFILGAAKFGVIGGLISRLGFLQINQHKYYKTLADGNRIKIRLKKPDRGELLDRRGRPIAISNVDFRVVLIPEEANNIEREIAKIEEFVTLSEYEKKKIFKRIKYSRKFDPIPIKSNLNWEQLSKIEMNFPKFQGSYIEKGTARYYPYKDIFSHVVGYVDLLADRDRGKIDKDLFKVPFYQIGRYGIERKYNEELSGIPGVREIEVNSRNREVREISNKKSIAGDDFKLSLNITLQKYVYERLKQYESASCLVMDTISGDILAMVSQPSFDPNLFTKGISHKDWKELANNKRGILVNKCLSGSYPPGSVFKPVVALAGLENGIINKRTKFYCSGHLDIGNQKFHCWKRTGHGYMSLINAMSQSCDVYFYELARKLGIEKINAIARKLGLGELSGLNFAEERSGLIPDKDWKLENKGTPWYLGDTINSAIGQGFVHTTPIQLARMMATIANGGKLITPRLSLNEPMESFDSGINSEHISLIKRSLYEVVNGNWGSARKQAITEPGMRYAGKSGTSQVRRISLKERRMGVLRNDQIAWHRRDHALFTGYAPSHNPRFVASVVIEHGGWGSGAAAPVVRDVLYKTQKLHQQGSLL